MHLLNEGDIFNHLIGKKNTSFTKVNKWKNKIESFQVMESYIRSAKDSISGSIQAWPGVPVTARQSFLWGRKRSTKFSSSAATGCLWQLYNWNVADATEKLSVTSYCIWINLIHLSWNVSSHTRLAITIPKSTALKQKSANFFCKGLDWKYFRLCGPYELLDSAAVWMQP